LYKECESFSKHVRYKVGDESKVQFWHDIWCREQLLKFLFPELFTIALGKDAGVSNHMQFRNGNIH
jgi:hypothetical protein